VEVIVVEEVVDVVEADFEVIVVEGVVVVDVLVADVVELEIVVFVAFFVFEEVLRTEVD
jgi:hypothetical protein